MNNRRPRGPICEPRIAHTPARSYRPHEPRIHEIVEQAWQVSNGHYNDLPERIKNTLNWYIWWRMRNRPWANIFEYTTYRQGDVFNEHNCQQYFDSLSDDVKRDVLRQAVAMGHPQGPIDDDEPVDVPVGTDNPFKYA